MFKGLPDVSQFDEQFKAIAATGEAECGCGWCPDTTGFASGPTYECSGCKRQIPWCNGSDGIFPDGSSNFAFCNECCSMISRHQEQALALRSNGAIAVEKS